MAWNVLTVTHRYFLRAERLKPFCFLRYALQLFEQSAVDLYLGSESRSASTVRLERVRANASTWSTDRGHPDEVYLQGGNPFTALVQKPGTAEFYTSGVVQTSAV